MGKVDRIPCINSTCKRTAPLEKFGPDIEIVCGKCWKLLPAKLKRTYKLLERCAKKAHRFPDRYRGITIVRFEFYQGRNWQDIRSYFRKPEKPKGIENFLEEMGM